VTFTYDELGNRLTMADGTGTTTWTRDSLYRPTAIEDGAGNDVLYDYDEAGRLVELTYPGGIDSVVYGYDDAGRLETVTDWLSNVTTYRYDNANRLTSTALGNGLTSDRTYDDADRLLSVENLDGVTPISTHDYTLDAVGAPATGRFPLRPPANRTYDMIAASTWAKLRRGDGSCTGVRVFRPYHCCRCPGPAYVRVRPLCGTARAA
jgi:YD repeat-containing protein